MYKIHCQRCGTEEKSLLAKNAKYIIKDTGEVRYTHMCRNCNTDRCRKYRHTPEGRKRTNAAVYRSIKKLGNKQFARYRVHYALLKGVLTRPDVCSSCKVKTKPHAHHEDHSKPLEVIWLCRTCHNIVEKNKRLREAI